MLCDESIVRNEYVTNRYITMVSKGTLSIAVNLRFATEAWRGVISKDARKALTLSEISWKEKIFLNNQELKTDTNFESRKV